MEKTVIDRRLEQMRAEGVEFKTGVHVGKDITADELQKNFDAICLAGGAMAARDLPVPGRELGGVHMAMEYLPQQNKLNAGDTIDSVKRISAQGKRVVIIGGGDTGSDCLGTTHRQGAADVFQFELLPQPPPNGIRPPRGHSGRCSFAPRTRMRKAASANGVFRPSASPGKTAV